MKAITRRFNLFLALMVLAALCGCQTEKHKKSKDVSALRLHIEAGSNDSGLTQAVSGGEERQQDVRLVGRPWLEPLGATVGEVGGGLVWGFFVEGLEARGG